jgi:hypothetical protein
MVLDVDPDNRYAIGAVRNLSENESRAGSVRQVNVSALRDDRISTHRLVNAVSQGGGDARDERESGDEPSGGFQRTPLKNILWLWGGCAIWAACFLLQAATTAKGSTLVWVANSALALGLCFFAAL